MKTIALINGPNLNLLGTREPEIYGNTTLANVEDRFTARIAAGGYAARCFQSNSETAIIEEIHALISLQGDLAGIAINAGAYTHTSIAIRDALTNITAPIVEIHISNVYARETFRQHSYLSEIANGGIIIGCGVQGYVLAADRILSATSGPLMA